MRRRWRQNSISVFPSRTERRYKKQGTEHMTCLFPAVHYGDAFRVGVNNTILKMPWAASLPGEVLSENSNNRFLQFLQRVFCGYNIYFKRRLLYRNHLLQPIYAPGKFFNSLVLFQQNAIIIKLDFRNCFFNALCKFHDMLIVIGIAGNSRTTVLHITQMV